MRKTKAARDSGGMQRLPANGGKWANTWPLSVLVGSQKMTDRRAAANNKLWASPWQKGEKQKKARVRPNEARLMRHVIKHDKHQPWISNFSFWFLLRTNEELITAAEEDAFADRVRWPLPSAPRKKKKKKLCFFCTCNPLPVHVWHDLLRRRDTFLLY